MINNKQMQKCIYLLFTVMSRLINHSSTSDLVRLVKSEEYKVKDLIEITNFSRSYIYKIKKMIKEKGDVIPKRKSGRPKVHNTREKQSIMGLVNSNKYISCKEISNCLKLKWDTSVSRFTISRYLKTNGYLKFVPRKIPLLTERHKLLRVNWAMKHRKTDWTKVVFTDESCFQFFSNKLKIWAKKRSSVMVPKWSPKIMVWGGISVRGTTTFGFDVGTVNSQVYQKILNEHLQSVHELYPDNFTLQQDKAKFHVSKDTLACKVQFKL